MVRSLDIFQLQECPKMRSGGVPKRSFDRSRVVLEGFEAQDGVQEGPGPDFEGFEGPSWDPF